MQSWFWSLEVQGLGTLLENLFQVLLSLLLTSGFLAISGISWLVEA